MRSARDSIDVGDSKIDMSSSKNTLNNFKHSSTLVIPDSKSTNITNRNNTPLNYFNSKQKQNRNKLIKSENVIDD